MEPNPNDIQSLIAPITTPKLRRKEVEPAESKIKKYEPLLNKITISFGIKNSEAKGLVEEVCSYANRHFVDRENCLSLRIWLAKSLVHKCIFRISCKLFSQKKDVEREPRALGYYSYHKSSRESGWQDMPLSFRVVFILQNIMGFKEKEIAEILNTTPIKIRERFSKAKAFIDNHCR